MPSDSTVKVAISLARSPIMPPSTAITWCVGSRTREVVGSGVLQHGEYLPSLQFAVIFGLNARAHGLTGICSSSCARR